VLFLDRTFSLVPDLVAGADGVIKMSAIGPKRTGRSHARCSWCFLLGRYSCQYPNTHLGMSSGQRSLSLSQIKPVCIDSSGAAVR
jgi:hypothetical protein